MGREMYMKPFPSDEIDRHTCIVSYPKSMSAAGGYGQRDQQTHMHTYSLSVTPRVHRLVVGMGREMYKKPFLSDKRSTDTHAYIQSVSQLPQEYICW